MILEWINRARVDPQVEMAACGSACSEGGCYSPNAPVSWNEALNRAARFHSDEMRLQGYFNHPSACTLVANINSIYPDSCDGSASCACVGGVTGCGSGCTSTGARIALFGGVFTGEIIASPSDPNYAFYLWLYEPYGGGACGFNLSNGHRFLIFEGGPAAGAGVSGISTVDFGTGPALTKIPSGSHFPRQSSSVEAWANWYDPVGGSPNQARINVDGTCLPLSLGRGSASNGAYHATVTGAGSGCHRYFFSFTDSSNNVVEYPTTGSLGIGPAGSCADWEATRPASCPSGPTPTPTQTPLPSATPTISPTASHSPTRTPTSTPSVTPTHTMTRTPTSTPTISPTASQTPTRTPTSTPSRTPTHTATRTPTSTPTSTPTRTPSITRTSTTTHTPTRTPTSTVTNTPTRTVSPTHSATRTPTSSPTQTASRTPTSTPSGTVTHTRTPTFTPSRTPTSTASQTPSHTSTTTPTASTPTPTASTPTPTASTPIPPAVNVGHSAGRPGGIACLSAALATQENAVGATRNDVAYDPSLFSWNGCTVNPLIGPTSATNKQAVSTALGAGVRRIDVSGPTQAAIADAALYACELTISPAAPLGTLMLGNTATAFTPAGAPIAGTSGSPGQVVVTTCPSDCDGDGTASIGELVLCINKHLGEPLCDPTIPARSCPVADVNNDGRVSLSEISSCAMRYLNGC